MDRNLRKNLTWQVIWDMQDLVLKDFGYDEFKTFVAKALPDSIWEIIGVSVHDQVAEEI